MRWSWIERSSGWAVEAVDREGRWLRLRVAAEIKEMVGGCWLAGSDLGESEERKELVGEAVGSREGIPRGFGGVAAATMGGWDRRPKI